MVNLKEILGGLARILFPKTCIAGDGRPVEEGMIFCTLCQMTLEQVPAVVEGSDRWAVARLLSPLGYGGAVAESIIRCKHGGMPGLIKPLALLAAGYVAFPPVDIIIPVPLHRRRLAERGFNQSALIARAVSRKIGVRWLPSVLKRAADTRSQGGLTRAAREGNVKSAFRVEPARAAAVAGARVLLVDDVWTTGATCNACAAALRKAGSGEVIAFTLCRVT
jgi:ComF family protein